jgi:hypothetical protein
MGTGIVMLTGMLINVIIVVLIIVSTCIISSCNNYRIKEKQIFSYFNDITPSFTATTKATTILSFPIWRRTTRITAFSSLSSSVRVTSWMRAVIGSPSRCRIGIPHTDIRSWETKHKLMRCNHSKQTFTKVDFHSFSIRSCKL